MGLVPTALDGLRVLDLATFVAAPFCCTLLGEFGAEVIKVEQPGRGDDLRRLGTPARAGLSYWWLVESRNKADQLVHGVEKSLKDLGDKVDGGERAKVESAISDLRNVLKGDDKATIDAKSEALMASSQKLGEKMYADAQAAAQSAGAAGAQQATGEAQQAQRPADENVVDAEFKEVKDKK